MVSTAASWTCAESVQPGRARGAGGSMAALQRSESPAAMAAAAGGVAAGGFAALESGAVAPGTAGAACGRRGARGGRGGRGGCAAAVAAESRFAAAAMSVSRPGASGRFAGS